MIRAALVVFTLFTAACAAPQQEPAPPNLLTDTRWALAPGGPYAPTIEFGRDNRAAGSTGCNRWFAQTSIASETISFTAIGSTRRACEAEIMEAERRFLTTLSAARAAQVTGDDLVLRDAAGAELARFGRAP